MAFAGLWASWHDPANGSRLRSCAIVTTQASGGIAALHERMPVVLEPTAFQDWLDGDAKPAHLHHLFASVDPDVLTWRRISTDVNSVRNNHPGLVVTASRNA
jgi:putative SOS response-associated peptidase YedK